MNFEYTGYPEMYILENFTRDLINLESYKKFIRIFIKKYDNKENIFKLGCTVHSDIFKEYKKEYRNNIDIAFEAIKKSMHNYNYAGEDVKNNKEVLDYIKKKKEELFKDL